MALIKTAKPSIAARKGGRRRGVSALRRCSTISALGALGLFAILPGGVAHADGKVSWTNVRSGRVLEVYQSNINPGAIVGTWPPNGSDTQFWWDTKLSNGYWTEANYNSELDLYAYAYCSQGVTQNSQGGSGPFYAEQWQEVHINTADGWELINRSGCDGDALHDVLSESHDNPNLYNVYLYPENYSEVSGSIKGCE